MTRIPDQFVHEMKDINPAIEIKTLVPVIIKYCHFSLKRGS